MPSVIDPETLYVSDLTGIWSPVQWELTPPERVVEVERQATASLLWSVSVPETILRLLLNETVIERVFNPPPDFDPELQGEWREDLVTFAFKQPLELVTVERGNENTYIEFKFGEFGYWAMEIEPEKVTIQRV